MRWEWFESMWFSRNDILLIIRAFIPPLFVDSLPAVIYMAIIP
jgi:hypothetical protein